jgi:hypothetical protein
MLVRLAQSKLHVVMLLHLPVTLGFD